MCTVLKTKETKRKIKEREKFMPQRQERERALWIGRQKLGTLGLRKKCALRTLFVRNATVNE